MIDLQQTLATLEDLARRRRHRMFDYWKPYPKQQTFFDMGAGKRERLFMGGTQVGKTDTGAFEATCHMTGEYPDWWLGKRFEHPTHGWIAGITSSDVRNVQQRKLCGKPGVVAAHGTGMIPKEAFADKPTLARGVTDAFDTIQVHHRTNGELDGVSTAVFKSYEQGRTKFQGDTIDWGWGDEEPEKGDVYNEFLSRLTGSGVLFTTFTPLFGRTKLVSSFLDENHPDRGVVVMSLDEAEHFTTEEKAHRLAGYKPHERDARSRGVPMLGSGAVFLTPEEAILEPRIEHVPAYWGKLWGIDFGIGHPFAATLILWDKDNDVIHVHHSFKMVGEGDAVTSLHHAAAMKLIGANVPVAWPKDGHDRERGSGAPIAAAYRKHGLLMLPEHATWLEGGVSTEAGIDDWNEREKSGRLKVANHLQGWLEERRFYHRKDGQIVKVRDDEMSATRITLMMKRFARAVALGGSSGRKRREPVAEGVDFDVFEA